MWAVLRLTAYVCWSTYNSSPCWCVSVVPTMSQSLNGTRMWHSLFHSLFSAFLLQLNRTPITPLAWSLDPEWSTLLERQSNCRSGTLLGRSDSGNGPPHFLLRAWRAVLQIKGWSELLSTHAVFSYPQWNLEIPGSLSSSIKGMITS